MAHAAKFAEIRRRITAACTQAGRRPDEVTLLAVSKTHPVEAIEALYHLGHRDFAESYVQELLPKAAELEKRGCMGIRWHFVGHLQTNKVKALIPMVHAIHTVDSEKLARELAKRFTSAGRLGRLPVFLEVNIDQEKSKAGLAPQAVPALAAAVASLPQLALQGLMCIPKAASDHPTGTEESRRAFARLKALEQTCRPHSAGQLSMGMSDDFEAAIQEGATHVRVGTAIFGPRPG